MEQLDAPPDASRPSDCALHSPARVRRWRVVDTVTGIPDPRTEIVGLRAPGGGTWIELSSFVRPAHQRGSPTATVNELGLRNTSLEVDDVRATIDQLAADGYGLVGGIGQYANAWRMAYVRGPEDIIVSLAERIADA